MNPLKSLAAVSFVTLCSRILGFSRDSLIAYIFGSGMVTDSFFVAFKLPNLLRRIFAEGAFSQAFVPMLIEHKNQKNIESTKIFIQYASGLLISTLSLVSLFGIFIAPWFIIVTAPGFSDDIEHCSMTLSLIRIIFPYILFISLASLAGSILNTWNSFIVPALSPIFLNFSMISFLLLATPYFHPPIIALAWAVLVGGILQFLYQLPFLKKLGLLVLPRFDVHNHAMRRLFYQITLGIIGVSVSQLSLMINTILASFLEIGSVSWIYYADRLMEFPIGVLGVALGTILLPALSKSVMLGQKELYSQIMDWGLRLCFLLAVPSSVALCILAKPLTIVLFQYGKFTSFDVIMTQRSLIAYSVGLVGLIVMKVLAPGFYARQDMHTPFKIAILTLIVTQVMNLAFIGPLKHAGLSLSIGLSACLNTGLLYWQLLKKRFFVPNPGWMKFFIRLLVAVLVMGIVLFEVSNMVQDWTIGNMPERLLRLVVVCCIGISVYFLMLLIVGFRKRDFSPYNVDLL
ncbi:murein biosynthesis integral membrane protein MurJ [Candidatus Erwinia haradaeae]|uniref:Probable lipid II flippase MurJ n=1 Tax=Candidatus Erwinia haradaeae TaxID=1922217 RepID=A0A451DKR9_9GAMM|nr:murein biosynthesis integral membrane protein MurJ [Candidatus Erwinia haradaeae]VFP87332.1 Lipid II flippase MurJ [Candidatus Erwinia haradaeae]